MICNCLGNANGGIHANMVGATRPTSLRSPVRETRGLRVNWLLAAAAGLAALAALPFVLIVSAYLGLEAMGLIHPGVSVGGVPVGGLTVPQAAAELDRVWNQDYFVTAVDTGDASRSWVVAPGEFGLRVDPWASAARAHAVGRGRGVVTGVDEMLTAYLDGWEVPPLVAFDPAAARMALESQAPVLEAPAVDAGVSLQGGQVVAWPAQPGRALDVESSLELLAADPAAVMLAYRIIPLVTGPVQPAIRDSAAAAAQAERLLASTFALNAYDPVTDEWFTWAPTREEIAGWLDVDQGGGSVNVRLDEAELRAYVEAASASLSPERWFPVEEALRIAKGETLGGQQPLQIRYEPTRYVVQRGDNLVSIGFKVGMPYWKLQEANPHLAINGLTVGETITVPPADSMLGLPIVPHKRIVISISQQHMWVYENRERLSEHVISTGIDRSPTMPGIFQVQTHYINAYASIWDLWMPHFLSIYEAVPGFWNGIHGLPLLSNGVRLWGSVLGRPASYGCIVMDLAAAERLYHWAEDGVVVEIQR